MTPGLTKPKSSILEVLIIDGHLSLSSLWISLIYVFAGIAKLIPLETAHVWLQGGTIKNLIYRRFLFSPIYYYFEHPPFNYARGYDYIFTIMATTSVLIELSAIVLIFTRKYSYLIVLLIAGFHFSTTMIGIGDFTKQFLVVAFALLNEHHFVRLDNQLTKD
jgi:hypothetical protein